MRTNRTDPVNVGPGWEDDGVDSGASAEVEAPARPRARRAESEVAALPFGRGARVKELEAKGVKEPSGAAFHEERGTLFVVGDRGHVVEMSRDGEVLHQKRHEGCDLEGLTVGPGGRLYAVAEDKPERILEIDPDTLEVIRKFKLDTDFKGKKVITKHTNDGPEGIAWVAREGCFFVLNQDRPPSLVKVQVPLGEGDGKKTKVRDVVSLKDVVKNQGSDLCFDARSGHFLVTESAGDAPKGGWVHEVTLAGEKVRSVALPGRRQEGLALDGRGGAYITQDSGGILRVEPG